VYRKAVDGIFADHSGRFAERAVLPSAAADGGNRIPVKEPAPLL